MGQSQDTFEAVKKGYELITAKSDHQSVAVAKVLTNASEFFFRENEAGNGRNQI